MSETPNIAFKTKDFTAKPQSISSKVGMYLALNYGSMSLHKALLAELTFLLLSGIKTSAGSFLRRICYRPFFKQIGADVNISENVSFRHPHKISIDSGTAIGRDCLIDAKGDTNAVTIGAGSIIGDGTLIYTKGGDIRIGNRAKIARQCMIFSSKLVQIGNNAIIGERSHILSGGEYDTASRVPFCEQDGMSDCKPTIVGTNARIGADVVIMNGRTVGDGCSIGDNSVVTKDIQAGKSAAGLPARATSEITIKEWSSTNQKEEPLSCTTNARKSIRTGTIIALSLFITMAVWFLITWPLPKYLFDGITMSSRNVEKDNARMMISGDHLQLLYRYWLFADALKGGAKPYHNVYELNTGNDDELFEVNPYYLPWSAVFAAGERIAGHAFGWNLTVFTSLWMGYLFTVLLVRRYCTSSLMAFLVSLFALVLPYRLLTIYMGSPTGFAMAFVPMLLYGVDLAIRDNRPLGGFLAGCSVLFSFFCDAHVFFFSALIIPIWCITALPTRDHGIWKTKKDFIQTFKALLPAIIIGSFALAIGYYDGIQSSEGSIMEGGRNINELNRYSPALQGFLNQHSTALNNQVFIGYSTVLLLVLGVACWLILLARKNTRNIKLFTFGIVGLAVLALATIALGTNGPFHAAPVKLARAIIPHFDMIRQPGKVFSFMPTMLALFGAFTFAMLFRMAEWRIATRTLAFLIIAGSFLECSKLADATICILKKEQNAYKVAAEEARAQGRNPHILCVPIWPGDSHESSIYEYYVSLYGIRMVNGYNPTVKREYVENVFKKLYSVNLGKLDASQIEMLKKMGVQHIIVHEDAFPEKVSPYPINFTLSNLFANKSLKFITKDDSAWAFRILADQSGGTADIIPAPTVLMPSIKHEAEDCSAKHTTTIPDETASYGSYVRLEYPSSIVRPPKETTAYIPDQCWSLRLRGKGAAKVEQFVNNTSAGSETIEVNSEAWSWKEIPLPKSGNFDDIHITLALVSGQVDLDCVQLLGGKWTSPLPGQSISIPAFAFFHAGCYDPETKSVLFRKNREPEALIFYGPKLPIEKGFYRLEMSYVTKSPAGIELGSINIRHRHDDDDSWVKVISGQPAVVDFEQKENIPFYMTFLYSRNADMSVSEVRLTRIR